MEKENNNFTENIIARKYQTDILETVINNTEKENKNFIINLETGRGKTYISIMIIQKLLEKNKDSKFVFLVENVALANQQNEYLKKFNLNTKKVIGGKNDITSLDKFETFLEDINVLVIISAIFYSCLCRGYFTLYRFKMIVFDECHHCDQGHFYNKIMRDFYFYPKLIRNKKDENFPIIIGLTATPCKQKIEDSVQSEVKQSLNKICNNLDSVFINEDTINNDENDKINLDFINNNISDEIIKVEKTHVEKKLIDYLLDGLLIKFYDVVKKHNEHKIDFLENEKMKNYLKEKFNCKNFKEYNQVLNSNLQIYRISKVSELYGVFEDFQLKLFLLLENLGSKYINSFLNDVVKELEKDIDYSHFITENFVKEIEELFKKIIVPHTYQTKKLEELLYQLENWYREDRNIKIIIFVNQRVVCQKLKEIINEHFDKDFSISIKADYVIGINNSSNKSFNSKMNLDTLQKTIDSFKNSEFNILIGTSSIEEGIDVSDCNIVVSFSSYQTPKSYIQMRGRARKSQSKFYTITENKAHMEKEIHNFIEYFKLIRTVCKSQKDRYGYADFRSDSLMNNKKVEIENLEYLNRQYIDSLLCIDSVQSVYNEIEQQINNHKELRYLIVWDKSNDGVISKKIPSNKNGNQIEYICIKKVKIFSEEKEIKSKYFCKKDDAKNHWKILFIETLMDIPIIDDSFNIIN